MSLFVGGHIDRIWIVALVLAVLVYIWLRGDEPEPPTREAAVQQTAGDNIVPLRLENAA